MALDINSTAVSVMSDEDYSDFCHTMNTYIHQYDVLMHRRKRILCYKDRAFLVCHYITVNILLHAVGIHVYNEVYA